jgi:hypothetical protein
MMKEKGEVAMRHDTAIFNNSGEHVANIRFNETSGPGKSWFYHDRVPQRAPMPDRSCVLRGL